MKRSLYLGLRPKDHYGIHFPVIAIEPVSFDAHALIDLIKPADWIFFTSQSAIEPFMQIASPALLAKKVVFSIGNETAKALRKEGFHVDFIPKLESQEGMIELLKELPLKGKKIFCGCSKQSRPCLNEFLQDKACTYASGVLYNTKISFDVSRRPALCDIDEVIFTSPTTVEGFRAAYQGELIPKNLILKPIGPVTEKKLRSVFNL